MKNYNDFQILNDEQYQTIKNEYTKSSTNSPIKIDDVLYKLQIAINSCSLINTNHKLSTVLIETKNNLVSVLSSLEILYPKLKNKTYESSNNVFVLLLHLFEIQSTFIHINQNENRHYYFHTQSKLLNRISLAIKNILQTLSTLNIVFYKFM